MDAGLVSGGEQVAVRCALPWVAARVKEAADGCLQGAPLAPTILVSVERARDPFEVRGWTRVARDAWCRNGRVVLEDVATSGFDLHASCDDGVPSFVFRWRPPRRTRAAALVLRARAELLLRAVLLQYPVFWAAAFRGRAPVHAPALSANAAGAALLVGASGVGKTTLVQEEVAAGGQATSDNLSVGDGHTVWGVVEPVRSERGDGRAMPHGRRESTLARRVPALRPGMVVVLRRGNRRRVDECHPDDAARALVASTYAAGELRRYWPVQALLALGTGLGPPHPSVAETVAAFTSRLPCVVVELPNVRGVRLADVLAEQGVATWT